jgi:hypothetical protein
VILYRHLAEFLVRHKENRSLAWRPLRHNSDCHRPNNVTAPTMSRPELLVAAFIAIGDAQTDRRRSVVIDRRYEPYFDTDRVSDAALVRAAPPALQQAPPMVDRAPPIAEQAQRVPEQPVPIRDTSREAIHSAVWARPPIDRSRRPVPPAPSNAFAADEPWAPPAPPRDDESYAAPTAYRSSMAWLVLTALTISGSAAYLAYAAIVVPDMPVRSAATSAAASLPDPLGPQRVPERPVAAPPVVVPPSLPSVPAVPPDPTAAPEPATPAERMAAAPAWTVARAVEPHRPARHRPIRHAHARKVEDRPDPLSWFRHAFSWLSN